MEMTGERRIEASRQRVWDALNDPEMLKTAIPGCESIERTPEGNFIARVAIRLGPMAAKFSGRVALTNLNPPQSYTISGEGNGGAMGFAKGGADVALDELGPAATLLRYDVKAQVGGKMAQLGGRLIDSTAKQMADQFFDRFAKQVSAPEEPAQTSPAAPAATAGSPAAAPAAPVERDSAAPVSGMTPEVQAVAGAGRGIAGLIDRIPRNLGGQSVIFWGGLVVWLFVIFLLFVG
ncbi:CoxG family protein [Roseomonas elaeocarpi]|uniref:CoxG family protein n=1 Tax=Roseomonas elaeocarpi TaxID=907779 RepID=A0ABV6JXQ9_9PROT